jgi:fatty acid desaturase
MFTILIPSAGAGAAAAAAAAGDDVFFQFLSVVTACFMFASLNSIMHETDTLEDESNLLVVGSPTRGGG